MLSTKVQRPMSFKAASLGMLYIHLGCEQILLKEQNNSIKYFLIQLIVNAIDFHCFSKLLKQINEPCAVPTNNGLHYVQQEQFTVVYFQSCKPCFKYSLKH